MIASSSKTRVLVSGTAFLLLAISLSPHPDVTLASAVSAAATSSIDCSDATLACVSDEDCYTCLTPATDDDRSDYEECLSGIYEAGGGDVCSTVWNSYCCIDILTEVDCMDNEMFVGYWGCHLESNTDCSADGLSCTASSNGAIKGNIGIVYAVLLLGTLVVAALSATG